MLGIALGLCAGNQTGREYQGSSWTGISRLLLS